jgi:hypothetical protein
MDKQADYKGKIASLNQEDESHHFSTEKSSNGKK